MKYQHSIEFEPPESIDALIEYLRYAQVLSVNPDTNTIRVYCPAGIGSPENWVNSNIERLASFRVNAAGRRRKT